MAKLDQTKTPYFDALKNYLKEGISPFDVPGHHMGNVDNLLKDYLGTKVYKADINAPIGLDNLANPKGVIKEMNELIADATGADFAFSLINGTSSGIIAAILSLVGASQKIILPRNVHKSVLSALILSGAYPIYVMPRIDNNLEIANQPSFEDYKKAILKYPSAKAVFVINPTYFGAIADLEKITTFAHKHNMAVIVDEAHGAHYYFTDKGPKSAIECGADISAVSLHKTGGSLTQSSILLGKEGLVSKAGVQKALNILNTTSPNSILLASIDTARHYMVNYGNKAISQIVELAKYAFEKISKIPGFIPRGKRHFQTKGCFNYDKTKLVIEIDKLNLTGFDVYHILKTKYHIQMELAETYTILGIIAIGSKKKHIDNLVLALKDISKKHYDKTIKSIDRTYEINFPFAVVKPRSAYQAPARKVRLSDALGQISKESVMIYPPGIPLIVPGEVYSKEIIDRLLSYSNSNVMILSDYSDGHVSVIDKDIWKHYGKHKDKIESLIRNRQTTPRIDGYTMPFEGDKHEATIMLLPYRKDTWREGGIPARKVFKKVIHAIAKFEKVYVGIDPSIYNKEIHNYENIENIIPIKINYNDSWARDTSPLFLVKDNHMRTVDFRFNAWGGDFDGLYKNWKEDDAIAKKISNYLKLQSYYIDDFILEGGSIHVDGKGTLITTEACLLSKGRNNQLSKVEIEEYLKIYLNVSKVIWVKNGIYGDETNEHVDNMLCFIKPGIIGLSWTDDKTNIMYKRCRDAYKTLSKATDAGGDKFEIVKLKLPTPQLMSDEEEAGINNKNQDAKVRISGDILSASYANYYQGDNFVILPSFGVSEDKLAYKTLKKYYPDKEIIQIDSREILLGGGNIHCITMQIPHIKGNKDEN